MGWFNLFQRKPSLQELAEEVERLLLKKVPAKLKKVQARGPYYCLLLCYCAEDFEAGWPPFLLLGLEAERQRILQRGDSIQYYLWAPDEMRNQQGNVEIPLHVDRTMNEAAQRHLDRMNSTGDYGSGMEVLRNVAKALNKRDWSKVIDVTPDFVVAAVDNTGEVDPIQDLEAVVPKAKFQALRVQGLV